jgi:hypothetical protein
MTLKPATIRELRLGTVCIILMWAALPVAPALAADLPRAPMFRAASVYDWSGFYPGAHAGPDWANAGAAQVADSADGAGSLGFGVRGGFADAGPPHDEFRSAALGGVVAPMRARDPADSGMAGRLAPIVAEKLTPTAADLARRLARKGADGLLREALFASNGALSAAAVARNLAEMGAVVESVNDQPAFDPVAEADISPATTDPIPSYPLSAAALADQKDRAARYAGADILASVDLAPTPSQAAARPRAFDASEGTPLDPLRNRTYDLNYPKVVPLLK